MSHTVVIVLTFLLGLVTTGNVNTQENSPFCLPAHLRNDNKDISNVVYDSSIVGCINRLESGRVKFTIATPDEALLGSTFTTENITVVGYFNTTGTEFDKSISTVVVSKGKRSLNDVKGLKYCHPGAAANIPPSMAYEFLKEVLKKYREICKNEQPTTVENFYHHLNLTLGPSCIAGLWAPDDNLDATLKKRFPKLLELCQTIDANLDPFEQSLKCLISGKGDVALTSMEKLEQSKSEMISASTEYFSLCKNNTLVSLSDPCIWSKQSWPLLLSNKKYVQFLQEAQEVLKELPLDNFTSLFAPIPLSTYVKGFREIPEYDDMCGRGLIWCTLTEEETKYCNLLRESFRIYNIQPAIKSCNRVHADHLDKYECISSIAKETSHVTFLSSDQLYTAKRANLEIVMYAKNTIQNLIRSLLIVNAAAIQTIGDLQNKKGCFSEFASIDWLSFATTFKDKVLKTSCFYDEELSKFVGDSCMPGVRDQYRKAKKSVNFDGVCKLCEASYSSATAVNCNANRTENNFATTEGALECLKVGAGHYAVIKFEKYLTSHFSFDENIKVMCKNGTLAEFSNDIDEDCYLSISPTGAVVTKENTTVSNVRLALMQLNKLNSDSGSRLFPFNPLSEVYNPLFDDSVKYFSDVELCNLTENNEDCKYVKELSGLIETADTCAKSFKHVMQSSMPTWTIVTIVLLLLAVIAVAGFYGYKFLRKKPEARSAAPDAARNGSGPEEIPLKSVPET